jgi:hypothetical protein
VEKLRATHPLVAVRVARTRQPLPRWSSAAVRSALEEVVATEVAAAGGAEEVVEEEEDKEDEQASAAPLARRQRVKGLLGKLVDLILVEF